MAFNATFNNISIMSWQSLLLVEENRSGIPRENHGQTCHIFSSLDISWVGGHNRFDKFW